MRLCENYPVLVLMNQRNPTHGRDCVKKAVTRTNNQILPTAVCSVVQIRPTRTDTAPLFFLQHSRLSSSVEIAVGEVEGSECHPSSELVLLKKRGRWHVFVGWI